MLNEQGRQILELFKTNVAVKIGESLKAMAVELASAPIKDARSAVMTMILTGINELDIMTRQAKLLKNNELRAMAMIEVVRSLNGALPLDYPYIVIICIIDGLDRHTSFVVSNRRSIPGIHDVLNPATVPICVVASVADAASEDIKTKGIFFYRSDDEDPFKF